MTVTEILASARELDRPPGVEATAWDSRILLAHSVGSRNPLALDPHQDVPAAAAARFERLWEERLSGVPVQHLVGEWDFFGRPFFVDSRALVPRPETELLIETALAEAPGAVRLLDLGTGSGILAVTWALERPGSRALAVDASVDALALARENALRHGVSGRLDLVGSDWTSALSDAASFDLAISNPPYLALGEAAELSPTVRDHDPEAALFAGEDGLDAIRRLLDGLPPLLRPRAPFVFEIGAGQAPAIEREVGNRREWRLDRIVPDLAGIPRAVVLSRT
ncbi:MAG TPA: peptide chain release factor N(5)-glutamine methyltransferase [Thermoanaerobaculia bacterium]|nr:peptide chain release factor N(5)-glutamine methyltransferase [Thermoanaerobaculia bacterium]